MIGPNPDLTGSKESSFQVTELEAPPKVQCKEDLDILILHSFLIICDQIEIRRQFHQCSLSIFNARRSQKLLNLTVFLALLGSARVKAARIKLVKLTPGRGIKY